MYMSSQSLRFIIIKKDFIHQTHSDSHGRAVPSPTHPITPSCGISPQSQILRMDFPVSVPYAVFLGKEVIFWLLIEAIKPAWHSLSQQSGRNLLNQICRRLKDIGFHLYVELNKQNIDRNRLIQKTEWQLSDRRWVGGAGWKRWWG